MAASDEKHYEACQAKNAKLIFFDNVYMLEIDGPMTEEPPFAPVVKKKGSSRQIAAYNG